MSPLNKAIGRPAVFTWTGNKAFNRTKSKKFEQMVVILDDRKFSCRKNHFK